MPRRRRRMLQVDRQPLGTSFASIRAIIVSRLPAQGKPTRIELSLYDLARAKNGRYRVGGGRKIRYLNFPFCGRPNKCSWHRAGAFWPAPINSKSSDSTQATRRFDICQVHVPEIGDRGALQVAENMACHGIWIGQDDEVARRLGGAPATGVCRRGARRTFSDKSARR
jgi:hypothetical protein